MRWLAAQNSEEGKELLAIVDLLEAYERKRWRLGKDPEKLGGKG